MGTEPQAAAAAVIRPVALDALTLNPEFQLRDRLEQWKVEEYAAVFDRLPPVLVARLGRELVLLDGYHRVAAARLLGRELIDARIEPVDANQAFVLTVRANAGHGLPLKTGEKKAAARGLLKRFPERSDRWIAQDAGLHHATVAALRAELEAGGQIDHLSHTEGRDGKHYAIYCAAGARPSPDREEAPAREPAERDEALLIDYDIADWPADEAGEAPAACIAHAVPSGPPPSGAASRSDSRSRQVRSH